MISILSRKATTMQTFKAADLYEILTGGDEVEDEALLDIDESELEGIEEIIADFEMSEHHLGGDDVVRFINTTLAVIAKGMSVFTWYGPDHEVLIVGYDPEKFSIIK